MLLISYLHPTSKILNLQHGKPMPQLFVHIQLYMYWYIWNTDLTGYLIGKIFTDQLQISIQYPIPIDLIYWKSTHIYNFLAK